MRSVQLLLLFLLITVPAYAQQVSSSAEAKAALQERAAKLERQAEMLGLAGAEAAAALLRRHTTQAWIDNDWVNSTRTTNEYSGGRLVEQLTESWDGDSWEPLSRTILEYSGDNLVRSQVEFYEGGNWVGEFRTLFTYSNGIAVAIVTQVFENGAWVDSDRTTLTVTNGQATAGLTEEWTGSAWMNSDRFTLEQQGDDVVVITQEWDGSAWVNGNRQTYTDTTIEELYEAFEDFATDAEVMIGFASFLGIPDGLTEEWDGSQWVNVSRQTTERNAQGLPVTITHETWDGSAWTGDTRFLVTYDAGGDITRLEYQSFAETWTSFFVETYLYENGLLSEVLTQFNLGMGLQNSSRVLLEWTGTGNTSVTDESIPVNILLDPAYPNPFNPQTTVRYHLSANSQARVVVFDALGRHVKTLADRVHAAGDYEVVFEASGLPSGTYVVRLETASEVKATTVTLLR